MTATGGRFLNNNNFSGTAKASETYENNHHCSSRRHLYFSEKYTNRRKSSIAMRRVKMPSSILAPSMNRWKYNVQHSDSRFDFFFVKVVKSFSQQVSKHVRKSFMLSTNELNFKFSSIEYLTIFPRFGS